MGTSDEEAITRAREWIRERLDYIQRVLREYRAAQRPVWNPEAAETAKKVMADARNLQKVISEMEDGLEYRELQEGFGQVIDEYREVIG
jgi:FKBP-type peptidyl-prolyl cis-trans isomerase